MLEIIVRILPLALALAFSTVPILAALLILLSPQRSRSSVPFLIGMLGGMFVVALLATVVTQFVPSGRLPRKEDQLVGEIEIVVGSAVIVLGLLTMWRARRRTEATVPPWLSGVAKLGPISSFGLALLLNLRPKSILLAVALGLTLRADADGPGQIAIALSIYTLIGASTVAIPIIAGMIAPARTEPKLVDAREWLLRHGEVITSGILILVGIVIILVGTGRL